MMRQSTSLVAAALIGFLALTAEANAQSSLPGSLLADRIDIIGDRLIASGTVDLWVNDQQVTAQSLEFDRSTNTLVLTGPIRVQDASGTVIFASSAELNQTLQTAILNDARLVLADRLQMAAVQMRRPDNRYTEMFKVAATSCYVCAGETPIWQIRAKRIVHDADERQIYLERAQLRLFDVPVFYLPWMRLPDPTLDRAAGFLIPRVKSNSELGFGLKLPYFIPIGDHKDLTLTPYVSRETRTLEYRYRQAFALGQIEVNGAGSRDSLLPGDFRGYSFASGRFSLPREYTLSFAAKAVTDTAYLRDYGYSGDDRLHSFVKIARSEARGHAEVRLSAYESLRSSENNATLPSIVLEGSTERRYFPDLIGGEARYELSFQTAYRYSDTPFDSADADTEVDGFDVARASLVTEWERNWIVSGGLIADLGAQFAIDTYAIRQHNAFQDTVTNADAKIVAGLQWPLMRKSPFGTDLLTPRLQYTYNVGTANAVPNQDSTRVEFDEGNLFGFEHTPGYDLSESGTSLTFGIDWQRTTHDGTNFGFTLGKILRDTALAGFSETSGLNGTSSDWLLAANWQGQSGLDLVSRVLIADSGSVNKAEAALAYNHDRTLIDAKYTYLDADLDENRPQAVSELSLATGYRINDDWTLASNFRYDFEAKELTTAGLGLQFKNECIDVNLTVSRLFASNPTVRASNDYGLTVELLGFGTDNGSGPTHKTCGE